MSASTNNPFLSESQDASPEDKGHLDLVPYGLYRSGFPPTGSPPTSYPPQCPGKKVQTQSPCLSEGTTTSASTALTIPDVEVPLSQRQSINDCYFEDPAASSPAPSSPADGTPQTDSRDGSSTETESYISDGSGLDGGLHIFQVGVQEMSRSDVSMKQRGLILDRLMLSVHELFRHSKFGYRSRGSQEPSNSQTKHATSTDHGTTNGHTKRKLNERDGGQENDETGDDSNKRSKGDGNKDEPNAEEKKGFACPYFKHSPLTYNNTRSCRGPGGWRSVHRLKEHLYRRHLLGPQCARCCQTFKSELKLKEHARSATVCTLREQKPLEGIDKNQEEQLRSRKSMFNAVSEEEKWVIVYEILFPDIPSRSIPSPYYDDDTVTGNVADKPHESELTQYEAYMMRELPRKIRQELEIALEKTLGPVEETLKNQLESLVRDCHQRLRLEYMKKQSSDASLLQVQASESQVEQEQGPICIPGSSVEVAQTTGNADWNLCLGFDYNPDQFLLDDDPVLPSDPWWSASTNEPLSQHNLPTPPAAMALPTYEGKGKGRAENESGIEEPAFDMRFINGDSDEHLNAEPQGKLSQLGADILESTTDHSDERHYLLHFPGI